MHLFCLDICFAARRLCQFSGRRLLLVLVGRSLERLKPWRWLSCFKRVSGDSLTKQACAVGPKPQWNANKEPTALTNRLSCFLIPSIVSSLRHDVFQMFLILGSFLHNCQLFCFDFFPWEQTTRSRNCSAGPHISHQLLLSSTSDEKEWDTSQISMQREEDLLLVLFEIQSNKFSTASPVIKNIYFKGNKIPHFGDLDEAKSS